MEENNIVSFDGICWDTVEFHLREAVWELKNILERVKDKVGNSKQPGDGRAFGRPLTEVGFAVQLEHAYHHLNSAWNARKRPMPEADRTYRQNEMWPRADYFKKFWPKQKNKKGCKK